MAQKQDQCISVYMAILTPEKNRIEALADEAHKQGEHNSQHCTCHTAITTLHK